jgi:sugar/nucleoside kinase (ribokinase family)
MARVLVLGGVSWDAIVALERFPSPAPQTLWARDFHEATGSTGAGKALNLARLGEEVTLHATLGEDGPGARIREDLARAGVRLVADPDPGGTERHLNLMDADGARISIYAAYARGPVPVDAARVEALLPAADAIALNIVPSSRALIPAVRRSGRPVWCDLHDWDGRNPWHAEFAGAAQALFLSSDALPGWRAVLEREVAGGKAVAVCTHGRHGSTALTGDGRWLETPAAPGFERVDTNGAGDAFFAGVLHARLAGRDWPDALRAGTLVAGLCVASRELAHPDLSPRRLAAEWARVYGAEGR